MNINTQALVSDCNVLDLGDALNEVIKSILHAYHKNDLLTDKESKYILQKLSRRLLDCKVGADIQSAISTQSTQIVEDYLSIQGADFVTDNMRNIRHPDTQRLIARGVVNENVSQDPSVVETASTKVLKDQLHSSRLFPRTHVSTVFTVKHIFLCKLKIEVETKNITPAMYDRICGASDLFMVEIADSITYRGMCLDLVCYQNYIDTEVNLLVQELVRRVKNDTMAKADDTLTSRHDTKFEHIPLGVWQTEPYQHQPDMMVLLEFWNGEVARRHLNQVKWEDCDKRYGIKRWMLLPD